MLADELAYKSAAEIALRIRNRELSPVEVTDAFISRIEARNPSITALVFYGFDDARKRAKRAEKELMSGGPLGPLHGVPSAIKDLFDFKPGWTSTFGGIRALKDNVIDGRCVFCERIEDRGGAVLLGKTNSPVMGFRGACDNYLFGPSRNPFNTAKNTGGSSGGSAAAVADGLMPFAEGTDGGGSIRIPASWCGVYGYKGSYGRVPTFAHPNTFNASAPFIFEGPITRTVEDAALAMTAIAGYDSRDPLSIEGEVDFVGATQRSIRGMKIAYSPDLDVYPVQSEVTRVVGDAIKAFEAAGAHVEEVKLGLNRSQQELGDLWCRLIMPLSLQAFANLKEAGLDLIGDHRDDFPAEFLYWYEVVEKMSVLDFFRDNEARTEVYQAVQGVLDNYDLLLSPTLACLPVDNDADIGETKGPSEINGEAVNPLIGWCMTYFINYSGHPAASVPAGLSSDGLPVGMQIIGRRYADADVLAASAAVERVRPWADSYKICADRPLS